MRGCIFGAGDYDGALFSYTENAYLVAADGGYRHLRERGVTPDLAVGDFDSLGALPTGVQVKRYPVRKDETDMALAAAAAREAGCDELFLFGGTGGRFDHTFANIALLHSLAREGVTAYLADAHGVMTVLAEGDEALFSPDCKGYLSVFSLTDVTPGVSLSGLAYPLEGGILYSHIPLGVSNAFLGETARVSHETGALLLFWECLDNPLPKRVKKNP